MSLVTGTDKTDAEAVAQHRRRIVAVVLALATAVAVGVTGHIVYTDVRQPGDTSAEAGFGRDMSRHHAQAVEMAMLAYQHASSNEIGLLGYDMALTQKAQIGIMRTWLQTWGPSPTGSQPAMAWMPDYAQTVAADGLMPGMATDAQLAALRIAAGRDFDVLFAQLMLRHPARRDGSGRHQQPPKVPRSLVDWVELGRAVRRQCTGPAHRPVVDPPPVISDHSGGGQCPRDPPRSGDRPRRHPVRLGSGRWSPPPPDRGA